MAEGEAIYSTSYRAKYSYLETDPNERILWWSKRPLLVKAPQATIMASLVGRHRRVGR